MFNVLDRTCVGRGALAILEGEIGGRTVEGGLGVVVARHRGMDNAKRL